MKGISAVLATVLIVVITVAVIGLAYGWATGLFGVVTEASEEGTGSTVSTMNKKIDIVAVTCENFEETNTNYLVFTVKNIGTAKIMEGELSAFVDELDIYNFWNTEEGVEDISLNAQNSKEIYYTRSGTYAEAEIALKVVAPAGPVTKRVTCPAIISSGGDN